jgi:hypothetical protein
VLGGELSPLGWTLGWIKAPLPDVLGALTVWREDGSGKRRKTRPAKEPWPECLQQLFPLEAPWTTELFVEHGSEWTCYLNNDSNGGDAFPVVGRLSAQMGVSAVIATHQPKVPVGHASTQFELFGPDGDPPLMYVRTLAAHAEDGRWSWLESGTPQEYERTERYTERLKRKRLGRPLLLEYLSALGIDADNDEAYGGAVVVRERPSWRTKKETLAEARARWQLDR